MAARIRPGTQRARLLAVFLTGRRLHRFQAEDFGAHALHSVVSGLEADGLKFGRKPVTIPGRWGDARVLDYWLLPESLPLARSLLGLPAGAPKAGDLDEAGREYLKDSRG